MSEAQMHDSRMNLNALFTAAVDSYIPGQTGATLANYIEFKSFITNRANNFEKDHFGVEVMSSSRPQMVD